MAHIHATGFYMVGVLKGSTAGTTDGIAFLTAVMGGVGELKGWIEIKEFKIIYGLLYNWYAVSDTRNIAAEGWEVPSYVDYSTLRLFLDPLNEFGENIAGGKLKEIGFTYWEDPNTGAINEVGFNARGGSLRWGGDIFGTLGLTGFWWDLEEMNADQAYISYVSNTTATFFPGGGVATYTQKYKGLSLRLLKSSTTLEPGEEGIYVGNDGKIYRTIAIGDSTGVQEWLANDLCEIKYRNGDIIPEVTDGDDWDDLITGALCAHSNAWENAYLLGVRVMGTLTATGNPGGGNTDGTTVVGGTLTMKAPLGGSTNGVTSIVSLLEAVVEVPADFAVQIISDVEAELTWTSSSDYIYDSIRIERSTNGTDFTEVDSVTESYENYTDDTLTTNTHYWWRIRGEISGSYSEYTDVVDDWTAMKFQASAYGTGLGRAMCSLEIITEGIYATIDGNGLFYDASSGGTGSGTWNMSYPGSHSKWVEVTSGTSTILIFHKNNITVWGSREWDGGGSGGWNAYLSNSPTLNITTGAIVRSLTSLSINCYGQSGGVLTGDVADLPSGLTILGFNGSGLIPSGSYADLPTGLEIYSSNSHASISGTIEDLPSSLISLYIMDSGNLTGDIADLPSGLMVIEIYSGSLTGNVSELPQTGALQRVTIFCNNTITGDIAGLDYSGVVLEQFTIAGSNTVSGNVSGFPDTLEYIYIAGSNTISGNVSGFPQTGLLYSINIHGNNTITGDVAGLDYSGCVLSTLQLTGYNTVSGDVGGLPSGLTYTYLGGFNTIGGDIEDVVCSGSLTIIGNNVISGDIGGVPDDTFTSIQIYGLNTISGDIANVPTGKTTTIDIYGQNTIYGDIEDLPLNIRTIIIAGSNTIGGTLSNLSGSSLLTYIQISGSNTITGDIAYLPNTLTKLSLGGDNTVYGDLNDLPSALTQITLSPCCIADYNPPSGGKTWMDMGVLYNGLLLAPVSPGGLSTAEIDELIIDLSDSTTTTYIYGTKTINLIGTNHGRSSASDSAVASLLSHNVAVSTTGKVDTPTPMVGVALVSGKLKPTMFTTSIGIALVSGILTEA